MSSSGSFILNLDSPEVMNSMLVGPKSATLAFLKRSGLPVPNGFVITAEVHNRVHRSLDFIDLLPDLESHFARLIKTSDSGRLIVRSSATLEESPGHIFPGIFTSVADINTFADLVDGIKVCMKSTESDKASEYCRLYGLEPTSLRMAVIVQEQIESIYSGTAFSSRQSGEKQKSEIYVELVKGYSANMMFGGEVGAAFSIDYSSEPPTIKRLVFNDKSIEMPKGTLFEIASLASKVEGLCGKNQCVEWTLASAGPYIVQARTMPDSSMVLIHRNHKEPIEEGDMQPLLPEERMFGLKGAVMQYYASLKWFSMPVAFLPPHSSLVDFEKKLDSVVFGSDGITIRYSFKNEIGLPRFFVWTKEEAVDIIRKTWDQKWCAIIHSYISVVSSFEMYISSDHIVLEHVPGIWESDSRTIPDIIIVDAHSKQVLRARENRKGKLKSPAGASEELFKPVDFSTLKQWVKRVEPYVRRFRDRFSEQLPLICHFVEDNRGHWQFLNLRRTQHIKTNYQRPDSFHVVRSLPDLKKWNGRTPILLQISLGRGSENLIRDFALHLPKSEGSIYIDFGLLSHPAMMLREVGISPIPAYLSHESIKLVEEDC